MLRGSIFLAKFFEDDPGAVLPGRISADSGPDRDGDPPPACFRFDPGLVIAGRSGGQIRQLPVGNHIAGEFIYLSACLFDFHAVLHSPSVSNISMPVGHIDGFAFSLSTFQPIVYNIRIQSCSLQTHLIYHIYC